MPPIYPVFATVLLLVGAILALWYSEDKGRDPGMRTAFKVLAAVLGLTAVAVVGLALASPLLGWQPPL